jgi:guanine nucleotide-binding protein G(i) subunit alpha
VLEKSSTRKIFRRVRDDTSSLYVQNDSASLRSRWTGRLSNFTKVFDFDRELFISKVYEKVIRSSLTPNESFISNVYERSMRSSPKPNSTSNSISVLDAQRRQEPSKEATEQERKKSELIDRQIQEDSRRLGREAKVLLLGDRDYGKILVKQLKIIHKERFTTEELIQY